MASFVAILHNYIEDHLTWVWGQLNPYTKLIQLWSGSDSSMRCMSVGDYLRSIRQGTSDLSSLLYFFLSLHTLDFSIIIIRRGQLANFKLLQKAASIAQHYVPCEERERVWTFCTFFIAIDLLRCAATTRFELLPSVQFSALSVGRVIVYRTIIWNYSTVSHYVTVWMFSLV